MLDRMRFREFGGKDFVLNDMDLEFNRLNVFVGQNGVGKSFIFKSAWFASTALNFYKMMAMLGIPNLDERFEQEVNLMFELTFHESEKLSGVLQIMDKTADIYAFTLAMHDGKLDHFQLEIFDQHKFDVGSIEQVKYNSKEARTFEQYEKYSKLKKAFGVEQFTSNQDFKQMGEFYRLYDLMWFEEVAMTIRKFEEEPQTLEKIFDTLGPILNTPDTKGELVVFKDGNKVIAKDEMLYVQKEDGELSTFSSLSSGEQSLMMMFIFAGGVR
jgi:predicted ATP-binding protein involved in virulence